ALEIVEKDISQVKLVVNGAGAAAISCTRFYISLGIRRENIVLCDIVGILRSDRMDLDDTRREFCTDRDLHTLTDAMKDADVFLGLSAGNIVSQDQLRLMAPNPIV